MLNFVYLRSFRLHFPNFGLIHALSTRGEKFELVLGYWMHLEGFQVVSSHFWALLCTGLTGWCHWSGLSECCLVHMLRTGLTGGVDRSDRSELG
jgi:hypothetical protein